MSENRIVTILGRKGSGKSTFAAELVADERRLIVIDTVGEYGADQRMETVHGVIECCDALAACERRTEFRISCRADETADLLSLLQICYELPDHVLVVEEASFFCSPSYLPPEISKLVRYGRHRRISQVYVSRRASEVHREITAQSDLIVSFDQREPRDIEYLAVTSGQSPRALALAFRRLPRFRCFVWGDLDHASTTVWRRAITQKPPEPLAEIELDTDTEGAVSIEPQ